MAKSWDRVSLEINTRPIRVERDIRSEDLLVPANDRILLLLAACLGCGLIITFLFIFVPFMFVSFLGLDLETMGHWFTAAVLGTALLIGAFLFAWELRNRRDLVNEL